MAFTHTSKIETFVPSLFRAIKKIVFRKLDVLDGFRLGKNPVCFPGPQSSLMIRNHICDVGDRSARYYYY